MKEMFLNHLEEKELKRLQSSVNYKNEKCEGVKRKG